MHLQLFIFIEDVRFCQAEFTTYLNWKSRKLKSKSSIKQIKTINEKIKTVSYFNHLPFSGEVNATRWVFQICTKPLFASVDTRISFYVSTTNIVDRE